MIDNASGRTDSASRLIHASPDRLFAAFADGETLMRWLPPENMSGRALAYDFREGGAYRIELTYQGDGAGKTTGRSDISTGTFLAIEPARLIKQSVAFESDDPALRDSAMTMSWRFDPTGEATRVTVTADHVPAAISRDDHLQGLNASLDNLARFVA